MNTDRPHQNILDHDVLALQGYLELGMQCHCLGLAKRLLRLPSLTASAFDTTVNAILIQAGDLRHWQPWIEAAYDRLSDADRKAVRHSMLCFYAAREEWNSALRHVPEQSDDPTELLFTMWTQLELRRDTAARSVYRQCRRLWRNCYAPQDEWAAHEVEVSALIEAIACYLAQTGRWRRAELWWQVGTSVRPFTANAWEGLLKIHTVRAIAVTRTALRATASEDWPFADETLLQFPHNAGKQKQREASHRLRKFDSQLAKVIPEKERFQFHASFL